MPIKYLLFVQCFVGRKPKWAEDAQRVCIRILLLLFIHQHGVRLCLISSPAWHKVLMRESWGQFYSEHRLFEPVTQWVYDFIYKGSRWGNVEGWGLSEWLRVLSKGILRIPFTKNKRNETMWMKRLRNLEV